MNEALRTFQKQFVKAALKPGIDIAALSIPRGNGKSWLAAHLLQRALTPGDELHVPGSEYLLCAGSIEQARLVYRFIRAEIEPMGGYSFIDSTTRISVTHREHQHPFEGTVQLEREDGHGYSQLPAAGGG